jgi:hypothetical protein
MQFGVSIIQCNVPQFQNHQHSQGFEIPESRKSMFCDLNASEAKLNLMYTNTSADKV